MFYILTYCTRIKDKGQIKIIINKETPFSALEYLYPFKIKENVAIVKKRETNLK